MPAVDVRRLDADAQVLGLDNRSEGIREALRLLHRRARHAALERDYDVFCGEGGQAQLSDVAAIGDRIAVDAIAGELAAD